MEESSRFDICFLVTRKSRGSRGRKSVIACISTSISERKRNSDHLGCGASNCANLLAFLSAGKQQLGLCAENLERYQEKREINRSTTDTSKDEAPSKFQIQPLSKDACREHVHRKKDGRLAWRQNLDMYAFLPYHFLLCNLFVTKPHFIEK